MILAILLLCFFIFFLFQLATYHPPKQPTCPDVQQGEKLVSIYTNTANKDITCLYTYEPQQNKLVVKRNGEMK
jgi:hypothetical protein